MRAKQYCDCGKKIMTRKREGAVPSTDKHREFCSTCLNALARALRTQLEALARQLLSGLTGRFA